MAGDWNATERDGPRNPPSVRPGVTNTGKTFRNWLESCRVGRFAGDREATYRQKSTEEREGWESRIDEFYTLGESAFARQCISETENESPGRSNHLAVTLRVPLHGGTLFRPSPQPAVESDTWTRLKVHKLSKEVKEALPAHLRHTLPRSDWTALKKEALALRRKITGELRVGAMSEASRAAVRAITEKLQRALLKLQEATLEVVPHSPPRIIKPISRHVGRLPKSLFRALKLGRKKFETVRAYIALRAGSKAWRDSRYYKTVNRVTQANKELAAEMARARTEAELEQCLSEAQVKLGAELDKLNGKKRRFLAKRAATKLQNIFSTSHARAYKWILGGDASLPYSVARLSDGSFSSRPEDIISEVEKFFSDLTEQVRGEGPRPWESGIDRIDISHDHDASIPALACSDREWTERVERTLKALPLQKAPGPDGILNEALRYAPEECVEAMAAIFQTYQLGYVPDDMLMSETVLLFKGGSKSQYDLKNYRLKIAEANMQVRVGHFRVFN